MKYRFSKFLSMMIVLFFLTGIGIAQSSRPSQELLNDIDIMETVLDKVLSPSNKNIFILGTSSKGFYSQNYGVIFNTHYSFNRNGIVSVNLNNMFTSGNAGSYFIKSDEEKEEKFDINKELDQLKKSLTHFMGNYASSIRDLKPDENVSVIVDFNGFYRNYRRSKDNLPRQMIASVSYANLKSYRKEKLSDSAFANKINFTKVEDIEEDISILGNVIKTSLEHSRDMGPFNFSGDVKGFHFQGHGVLFITNLNWNYGSVQNFFLGEKSENQLTVSIAGSDRKHSKEETSKHLVKLEKKLIRSLSNYGHTLRDLKPNEWVELAVNFKGTLPGKDYSKTIIKVKKKTIDDYYRDKINYDQFKKLVHVIYY